ncbi:MAG: MaoC family dehydratase N-terminal domain-containing protein [Pseudomonadota bacterium]|nr:MaoC family dehydratase N-terminal domain-containing protein [Pseudomonadota bacterium]
MQVLGLGLVWDELTVGQQFRTIGRTILDSDITAFCSATGMTEVLFTNAEYITKYTNFEGRLVPGSLVFCMAEGLLMQATMQYTGLAFLNAEMDVKGPTVAGDTIHVELEVAEIKPTSKGRGLVRTSNVVKNQRGEVIMTYNPLRMMAGRAMRDAKAADAV